MSYLLQHTFPTFSFEKTPLYWLQVVVGTHQTFSWMSFFALKNSSTGSPPQAKYNIRRRCSRHHISSIFRYGDLFALKHSGMVISNPIPQVTNIYMWFPFVLKYSGMNSHHH